MKQIEGIDYYEEDKVYCVQNAQGVVETYKNGKKIGEIVTMGDLISEVENSQNAEK